MVTRIFSFIRNHIRAKLFIIYVIVISMPIAIFGIISYAMSSSVLQAEYSQSKEQLNEQMLSSVDETINNLENQSMAIYLTTNRFFQLFTTPPEQWTTSSITEATSIDSMLRTVLQMNKDINQISIVTPDGTIKFGATQNNGTLGSQYKNTALVDATFKTGGIPVITVQAVDNGDTELTVSRALMDFTSHQTLCAIILEQSIQPIAQMISDNNAAGGVTALFDGADNMIYVAGSQPTENLVAFLPSDDQIVNQKAVIGGGNMALNITLPGLYGWRIMSMIPTAVFSEKAQFIKNINITLLFILLLLALFISIMTSNLITKPLKRLTKSFLRLQGGDFGAKVHIKGSDELSQIGNAFNEMTTDIKKLITQRYEMKVLMQQAELDALQSQINPHFLFNTLASVKEVAAQEKASEAGLMVQSLSELMRYSMPRGADVVLFSEELSNIKNYLSIQEHRYRGKYTIRYMIDEEITNWPIVRLTLQPIVENALRHGLEPKGSGGELIITARPVDNYYYIYISDNGVGISPEKLTEINALLMKETDVAQTASPYGLGLFNVNARVKLRFGSEYGLQVFSEQGAQTTVRIKLPQQWEANTQ